MPQAPPSEACPPYLLAATREIEMAAEIELVGVSFGIKFRHDFWQALFRHFCWFLMDFGSHVGCILASFSIRRTPPGWRACQIILINPVYPVFQVSNPPLPPGTAQKSTQNAQKNFPSISFQGLLASNFCINFLIYVFSDIFRFWSDFCPLFGCILASFSILFA